MTRPSGSLSFSAGVCGLEEDLEQVWRMIETGARRDPEDAAHWVRVYRELVDTSQAMLDELRRGGEEPAEPLLARRVAIFRDRLRYWEEELRRGSHG